MWLRSKSAAIGQECVLLTSTRAGCPVTLFESWANPAPTAGQDRWCRSKACLPTCTAKQVLRCTSPSSRFRLRRDWKSWPKEKETTQDGCNYVCPTSAPRGSKAEISIVIHSL